MDYGSWPAGRSAWVSRPVGAERLTCGCACAAA